MVHSKVVWGVVSDNWRSATTNSTTRLGYLLRLKETWLRILNQRQTAAGAPNEDFAAAEHYSYARLFTASTGDNTCIGPSIRLYDAIKLVAMKAGLERAIRTNNVNYAPVAPSAEIRAWSDAGTRDGLRDFHRLFPGQTPQTLKACESLAGSGEEFWARSFRTIAPPDHMSKVVTMV
jgi:hypothetical protein